LVGAAGNHKGLPLPTLQKKLNLMALSLTGAYWAQIKSHH